MLEPLEAELELGVDLLDVAKPAICPFAPALLWREGSTPEEIDADTEAAVEAFKFQELLKAEQEVDAHLLDLETLAICPIVPALLWQLIGMATGVASTAVMSFVVSMVRERPGNAG